MMEPQDWQAFVLTLKLASVVTALLMLLGTPLAWWLTTTRSRWRRPVAAMIALPLVLPPTVLGFYLLLAMGPQGWVGKWMAVIDAMPLPFSFRGLVVASMIYSLPFVVQPLCAAFMAVGRRPLEVAASLGAGPLDRFFSITLPLSLPGFAVAAVLGFAHTVGEFGVALMVGGNLPGSTRVASMAIYDRVEAGEFSQAHGLSLMLVGFSFAALLAMSYLWSRDVRHD